MGQPLHVKGERVLVNFRIARQLLDEIDAAAARAGLNRTEWVASTLTVACREGAHAAAVAVAAGAAGCIVEGCAHPKHLRAWRPLGLICGHCLTVLERTRQGA